MLACLPALACNELLILFSFTSPADNTTHASCGINHLRIDLDRRYYNASIYSAITLRDPACTASISPANITLGSAPHLCNWTIEETSSKITYRNTVIMKVHGVRGMVIRNQDRRIDVSCEYDRSSYVSAPSFKPDWIVIANEGKLFFIPLPRGGSTLEKNNRDLPAKKSL